MTLLSLEGMSSFVPLFAVAPGVQRPLVVAVPLLKVHPLSQATTVTCTKLFKAGRVFLDIRKHWQKGDLSRVGMGMMRTSVLIATVGTTIFEHSLLNIFAVSAAFVKDIVGFATALSTRDEQAIRDAGWAITGSGLMLASTLYGAPEVILASMIFGIVSEVYKSIKHYKQGKWLEATVSVVLAMVFAYQTSQTAMEVRERWAAVREEAIPIAKSASISPKFKALAERIDKGQDVEFLKEHPLGDLAQAIKDRGVSFEVPQMGVIDFGAHTSYLGGSIVKGSVINLRERNVDGHEIYELAFNVNHVHREKLNSALKEYQGTSSASLNSFADSRGVCEGDLRLSQAPFQYLKRVGEQYFTSELFKLGNAQTLTCKGVGSISVGASPEVVSLYDRVVVRIDKSSQSSHMHFLLSLFGLDGALKPSTPQELDRLKIGQLFRAYYPQEATSLERLPSFFKSPLEALKKTIIDKVPQMETIFNEELAKMVPQELLPGKIRYTIPNLAQKAQELGARALMSGVGYGEAACERVAAILKTGALSSQGRYEAGLFVHGLSSNTDHLFGGADSVFTRLVTDAAAPNLGRYSWAGDVQLIYSLNALDRGTYQYNEDSFGSRMMANDKYKSRSSILDFVQQQQQNISYSNEVMLKDYVPPEEIVGCVVSNQSLKNQLINALKKVGIVQEIGRNLFVRGIPVDDFIRVGGSIGGKMLARAMGC